MNPYTHMEQARDGHARLSCSNKRWPNCPGSVREEARYEDVTGAAAIDGTGTHELISLCFDTDKLPVDYVGRVIGEGHDDSPNGWLVDQDRADRAQMAFDYVDRRIDELSDLFPDLRSICVVSETRSNPGGMIGRTDWWGSCDITIEVKTDTGVYIEVIDYKDGRGWVDVKGDTQTYSYLIGKVRNHIASGPDQVRPLRMDRLLGARVAIVQPKTHPPVRYEEVTHTMFTSMHERLENAARATDDPDAPLIAGEWCKWCKHKPNCSAKTAELVSGETDMELPEDLENIDTETLTALAFKAERMIEYFKRVLAETEKRVKSGLTIEHNNEQYAMRPGRRNRAWRIEEEEVVKMLRGRRLKKDDCYTRKLLSPAQVMKLETLTDAQKEKIAEKYIEEKPGKPILKRVKKSQTPDFF